LFHITVILFDFQWPGNNMCRIAQLIHEDAFELLSASIVAFIHRFSFSILLAWKQTISLSDICCCRSSYGLTIYWQSDWFKIAQLGFLCLKRNRNDSWTFISRNNWSEQHFCLGSF
jgi:hypothetical protein